MPITVLDVEEALSSLGGQGSISEILEEVERIAKPPLPQSARQIVRARLQEYCPESSAYNGIRPIFRNVFGLSERKGVWALRLDGLSPQNPDLFMDEAEPSALEGRTTLRKHLRRERSRSLVEKFKSSLTEWSCRICDFDFEDAYGEIGLHFIEAHHLKPIATLEAGEITKMRDLLAVCSNCHRMLHRDSQMDWLGLRELVQRRNRMR